ncbi:MAG: hypothetical protein JWR65_2403 [Massilia sp.]|nr:hypothetical protein [Massilia sp.]
MGDPSAQYDKAAKRWLLTQFAWLPENFRTGPYYQCIAVSTTSDATGTYYRYVLEARGPNNALAFNDYPKAGVWPDAYYFTLVLFDATVSSFIGSQAGGLDRATMLAGAATLVRCATLGTEFGVLLPSDLDGDTAPPAHSPNYLMSLNYGGDDCLPQLLRRRLHRTAGAGRAARRAGRPFDVPRGLPQFRQSRGAGAEPFGAAAGGTDRRPGRGALVPGARPGRHAGGLPARQSHAWCKQPLDGQHRDGSDGQHRPRLQHLRPGHAARHPLHRPHAFRAARPAGVGGGDRQRRRGPGRHLRPPGRLQRDDGRPGQRLRFLVHPAVHEHHRRLQLAHRIADFRFINCQ